MGWKGKEREGRRDGEGEIEGENRERRKKGGMEKGQWREGENMRGKEMEGGMERIREGGREGENRRGREGERVIL